MIIQFNELSLLIKSFHIVLISTLDRYLGGLWPLSG